MLMLFAFLSAALAETTEAAFPTLEGASLEVKRSGRADYKVTLGGEGGDGIKCTMFYGVTVRSILTSYVRTAAERAKANEQVGPVLSFGDGMAGVLKTGNAAMLPGLCALGIDALPGSVVLTMGTVYKSAGRTATLTPDVATQLAAFLSEK